MLCTNGKKCFVLTLPINVFLLLHSLPPFQSCLPAPSKLRPMAAHRRTCGFGDTYSVGWSCSSRRRKDGVNECWRLRFEGFALESCGWKEQRPLCLHSPLCAAPKHLPPYREFPAARYPQPLGAFPHYPEPLTPVLATEPRDQGYWGRLSLGSNKSDIILLLINEGGTGNLLSHQVEVSLGVKIELHLH